MTRILSAVVRISLVILTPQIGWGLDLPPSLGGWGFEAPDPMRGARVCQNLLSTAANPFEYGVGGGLLARATVRIDPDQALYDITLAEIISLYLKSQTTSLLVKDIVTGSKVRELDKSVFNKIRSQRFFDEDFKEANNHLAENPPEGPFPLQSFEARAKSFLASGGFKRLETGGQRLAAFGLNPPPHINFGRLNAALRVYREITQQDLSYENLVNPDGSPKADHKDFLFAVRILRLAHGQWRMLFFDHAVSVLYEGVAGANSTIKNRFVFRTLRDRRRILLSDRVGPEILENPVAKKWFLADPEDFGYTKAQLNNFVLGVRQRILKARDFELEDLGLSEAERPLVIKRIFEKLREALTYTPDDGEAQRRREGDAGALIYRFSLHE